MTTQSVNEWTKSKGRYEFYSCMSGKGERPEDKYCGNGRTHISHADAETWRQVAELLKDRESIQAQVEASARPDPSLDADLRAHHAEVAKAESTINRLGDVDDETIAAVFQEWLSPQKTIIAAHTPDRASAMRRRCVRRSKTCSPRPANYT